MIASAAGSKGAAARSCCSRILPCPGRDGAGALLQALQRPFPVIRRSLPIPDTGYQGPRVAAAISIAVEIVNRKPDQIGFGVRPRRWVVERFFTWISRNRGLWKDAEATIESATTFPCAAAVMILVRRVARHSRAVSVRTVRSAKLIATRFS